VFFNDFAVLHKVIVFNSLKALKIVLEFEAFQLAVFKRFDSLALLSVLNLLQPLLLFFIELLSPLLESKLVHLDILLPPHDLFHLVVLPFLLLLELLFVLLDPLFSLILHFAQVVLPHAEVLVFLLFVQLLKIWLFLTHFTNALDFHLLQHHGVVESTLDFALVVFELFIYFIAA
jgi:hypothetical protein